MQTSRRTIGRLETNVSESNHGPDFHDCDWDCTTCGRPAQKLQGVDEHQADPVKSNRPAIQDLVMADIEARKQVGLKRYGTLLQGFNGRDALLDAYQEALDLAIYLRQVLYEQEVTHSAKI